MKSRIVIVGAGGRLGAALARAYATSHEVVGFNHAQLDLASSDDLRRTLHSLDFHLLINAAGQTNVDRCEKEPKEAYALNAEAPRLLGEICAQKKARLIHISTDYVFDGAASAPYREEDRAEPISVYGASKRQGERHVLAVDANHLVVRVSWIFGPDRPSFIDWVVGQARLHEQVEAIDDKISTPTYTLDLARMLLPLFAPDFPGGLLHLANRGQCSWREYGQWALDCLRAEGAGLRTAKVEPITLASMKTFVAQRPVYTVLSTEKFVRLSGETPRDWRDAVAEYARTFLKQV